MKHLRKIFEIFESDRRPLPGPSEEMTALQDEINKYNAILLNDIVWRDYYLKIPNYYVVSRNDKDNLEEIIEFAKKRIKDIEKENTEIVEEVKELFKDLEEDCDDYVDTFHVSDETQDIFDLILFIRVTFTDKLLKPRKKNGRYSFQSDEVRYFWPHMISLESSLRNLGLKFEIIWYQTNATDILLKIYKIK